MNMLSTVKSVKDAPCWNLPFANFQHETFFMEVLHDLGRADVVTVLTIYLMGATAPTRAAFLDMVGPDNYITNDLWAAPWQTADSRRVIALAVNLTTGGRYQDMDPATLFDTSMELCLVMQSAIAYWHAHKGEYS